MKILINGASIGEIVIEKSSFKELLEVDRAIGHIKKNKVLYGRLVFLVALLLMSSTSPIFASAGIDTEGLKLFYDVVGIIKWVFSAKAVFEIGQNICSGCDISDITSVIAKYSFGYGAILAIPKIFEKILVIVGGF